MLRVKSKEAGNLPGLMVLLWAEALDKSPLGLTFSRQLDHSQVQEVTFQEGLERAGKSFWLVLSSKAPGSGFSLPPSP
jgi:hypothetical protein